MLVKLAHGFTLVEALIVLSIAAIVLAIAVPNLSFLINSMNARSASFDLIADLALARSEAIKRNRSVTVAPLVGTNWAQGWRIADADNATVRERQALPASLSVASAVAELRFAPNGRVGTDVDTGLRTWAITSSNATPRCVVITPTGTARSSVGKAGGC